MTELGTKRKDSTTGFQGTVTCIARYLSGYVGVCLEGMDKNGHPVEQWCDERRLTAAAKGAGKK